MDESRYKRIVTNKRRPQPVTQNYSMFKTKSSPSKVCPVDPLKATNTDIILKKEREYKQESQDRFDILSSIEDDLTEEQIVSLNSLWENIDITKSYGASFINLVKHQRVFAMKSIPSDILTEFLSNDFRANRLGINLCQLYSQNQDLDLFLLLLEKDERPNRHLLDPYQLLTKKSFEYYYPMSPDIQPLWFVLYTGIPMTDKSIRWALREYLSEVENISEIARDTPISDLVVRAYSDYLHKESPADTWPRNIFPIYELVSDIRDWDFHVNYILC